MDEATACSEYLCTLQPPSNSALAHGLLSRRVACLQAGFGLDSTGLYPPHVSVTGFFEATQKQAANVCKIVATELAAVLAPAALPPDHKSIDGGADTRSECVKVQQVVTTEGGHVLLDVVAPLISNFAQVLSTQAALAGVHVRPKTVRHLSLASGKSPEQRVGIARLYEDLLVGGCCWDLVVSRLSFRSDVEQLQTGGSMHVFEELLRLKVPCAAKAMNEPAPNTLMSQIDAAAAAVAAYATPLARPVGETNTKTRVPQVDHGQEHESDHRRIVGSINIKECGMDSSPHRRAEDEPGKDSIAGHFAKSVALMQKQLTGLSGGWNFEAKFPDTEGIHAGHLKVGCPMTQVTGENSMLCAK